MADAVRFEQIVMNLLSNAIKFTPQGGSISVRLGARDGAMRLDVSDSGQGIAPGSLAKVFDMFGQPNSVTTRAKGGLGIGLALVRELVNLHGGRIEAHSEGIGKGACFSVWLPLHRTGQRHEGGAPGEGPGRHRRPARPAGRRRRGRGAGHASRCSRCTAPRCGRHQRPAGARDPRPEGHRPADLGHLDAGHGRLRRCCARSRKMPRYAMPAAGGGGHRPRARAGHRRGALQAGFSAHLGKPLSVDRLLAIIPAAVAAIAACAPAATAIWFRPHTTSPIAYRPGTVVRWWSSTTILSHCAVRAPSRAARLERAFSPSIG
jgi:two-component system CheB/CheR fusion protein